jgi:hypothetical protein
VKIFSLAAMAAIEAGTARVGGAVEIASDPPIRAWSGDGTLPQAWVPGASGDFIGVGFRALAQVSGGTLGSGAQKLELGLSAVDPELLALIDADEVRQAPVVLWRLIFDGSGTELLDAKPFRRGRVDVLDREETAGGAARVIASIEGTARGLGRRTGRMRSDADQRLVDSNDGGLSRVTYAGEKTLYFGGKAPERAGVAIGG